MGWNGRLCKSTPVYTDFSKNPGAHKQLLTKNAGKYFLKKWCIVHTNNFLNEKGIGTYLLKKTGADKHGEKEGVEMLELLESIDDDLDRLGVGMVKISETSAAK